MFRAAAWVAAVLPLLTLAVLFVLRAGYPYELEWQEGGMLAHVARVAGGEGLYVEPKLEFLPFPYPPLFAWCGAASAWVIGEGFLALRLVSILASLLLFVMLVRCGEERAGRLGGWLAAGLFAASYRFCGAWLDVARVDALFLALTFGAYAVTCGGERDDRGLARPLLAAALLALATLAKQSALLPCAGLVLGRLLQDRRAGLTLLAMFVVLAGLAQALLNVSSDGRYAFWIIEQLASHELVQARIGGFWIDLGLGAAPLLLLALLGLRGPAAADAGTRGVCAGLVAAAWLASVHVGAYDISYLPAVLALALLAGPEAARRLRGGGASAAAVLVLVIAQLGLFAYDPAAQVPSAADEAAGERLVQQLRQEPGEVLVPYHGYLARRAGKQGAAHAMAIIDLLQSSAHDDALRLVQELEAGLAARRWGLVWLDDPSWEQDLPALLEHYERVPGPLDDSPGELFRPVTGAPWRPLLAYRPRGGR